MFIVVLAILDVSSLQNHSWIWLEVELIYDSKWLFPKKIFKLLTWKFPTNFASLENHNNNNKSRAIYSCSKIFLSFLMASAKNAINSSPSSKRIEMKNYFSIWTRISTKKIPYSISTMLPFTTIWHWQKGTHFLPLPHLSISSIYYNFLLLLLLHCLSTEELNCDRQKCCCGLKNIFAPKSWTTVSF